MTAGHDRAPSIAGTLALVALTLWALGWLGNVGGAAVHLLLLVAAALAVVAWRASR